MRSLDAIEEFLRQRGIDPSSLEPKEPAVIRDIGEALMLSLQNDDDIGNLLVMLLQTVDLLSNDMVNLLQRIEVLENA